MNTEPNLLDKNVERLIAEPLNPEALATLIHIKPRVISYITQKFHSKDSVFSKQRYITLQLSRLVHIADALYREVSLQRHRSLKKALVWMIEIIDEISALLPECDSRVMLPKLALDRAKRKYWRYPERLAKKFESFYIPPDLIQLSLLPLTKFLYEDLRKGFSKRQFCYLEKHARELNAMTFDGSHHESVDNLLLDKLISLNYNNPELYSYCIDHVLQKIIACENDLEKEKILKDYRRRWRALSCTLCCYDLRWKSIRNNLIRGLSDELKHLKQK